MIEGTAKERGHYVSYKGHVYLCVQPKMNAILDVYGRFRKCHEVSESCYMLQLGVERCGSISPVFRYVLTITRVKILHNCDETSLTIKRITVSLPLM